MVRVLPAALALVSAASPATVFGEFYKPQPATILGKNGIDPTPDAWKDEFPIYYVVIGGDGGIIVRAIIDEGDDVQCPKLKYKEQMQMLYDGKEPPHGWTKASILLEVLIHPSCHTASPSSYVALSLMRRPSTYMIFEMVL